MFFNLFRFGLLIIEIQNFRPFAGLTLFYRLHLFVALINLLDRTACRVIAFNRNGLINLLLKCKLGFGFRTFYARLQTTPLDLTMV